MDNQVPNFTPVAPKESPKGKKSSLGIVIGFLGLLLMVVGLVGYLTVLKKPIKPKVPAEGPLSVSCSAEVGQSLYGLRVTHTFTGPNALNECLACKSDRDCYTRMVGTLDTCNAPGNTCTRVGDKCTIEKENAQCNFSTDTPACSVTQFDCVNKPGPTDFGSILNGSGANFVNCGGCVPIETPTPTLPVSTPTPSPTVPITPSSSPTPSPTGVISSTPTPSPTPTGTPSPTSTPSPTPTGTPGPTSTPPPGPSTTPIPVACGTKGCDNSTNPCRSGSICVQAQDGSNYCSLPEFQTACKSSPSQSSCCTSPAASPTPTEIILAKVSVSPTAPKTTQIPSVGVAKYGAIFGILSIGIVLLGLIF